MGVDDERDVIQRGLTIERQENTQPVDFQLVKRRVAGDGKMRVGMRWRPHIEEADKAITGILFYDLKSTSSPRRAFKSTGPC